jgi:hypothetical protein
MTDDAKVRHSKKISESKKGIPRPKEVGEKLSKLLKGKSFVERYGEDKAKLIGKKISESNKGQHYHSEEHKQNLSSKLVGNKYGKHQSEKSRQLKREKWLINTPGKNPTDETRKKMSESRKGIPSLNKGVPRRKVTCPYCGKEGGNAVMIRWHFENCKNK